jgi:HAD domain in Swiss Army Knife RNA repair proteins
MMKYLFLDIDGVLNNYPHYEAMFKTYPPAVRNEMTRQERDQIDFDPANVAQLERICMAQPELEIVISSTWRCLNTLPEIRGYIKTAGGERASSIIVGKTPYQPELLKIRGQEIQRWLIDQMEENVPYVILDDDSDMTPEQKEGHFVQTHYLAGLTPELADEAINILG